MSVEKKVSSTMLGVADEINLIAEDFLALEEISQSLRDCPIVTKYSFGLFADIARQNADRLTAARIALEEARELLKESR